MVKNVDLFVMRNAINSIKNMGGNNFKLAIMINEEVLSSRIEKIESLIKPSDKINEYRMKYRSLLMDHAELEGGVVVFYENEDSSGKKLTNGNGFPNIIKDKEEFKDKESKLNEEYKEEIKEHEDKVDEFNKTLDEEAVISFIKFSPDILPELDYNVIKAIKPLLKINNE